MAKYQQYNEYKDSGVEWSEKIPTHWKTASLSKLFMIKAGGDLQSALFSETKTLEHKHPIYTNANDSKAVYGYTKKPNFPSNTITVSGRGEVGFAVYRNHEFDAIIRLLVLIPFIKLDGRFFAYFINEVIDFNVQSSAIGQLSTLQISPYKVAIPPYQEQSLISDYLDHETAQIDTLIEKQQTLIQLLKEKRQAVISHAVTPNKDEQSAKLGYFIDILSGYSFPSAGYQAEAKGNTALLRGINVGVGALKWDETVWWSRTDRDGLEAFELEEGDIVFGMDRPWISAGARVAEVTKADLPCLLLQRVIRIRANQNTYQPFIKLCLASKEFKFSVEADLTGVSVPHISPDQVKSFLIRDIGYEQQKLITDNASKEIKVLESIEESAEQAIQLMQERRTALISAAVTGKIDVRGWVVPE